MDLNNRVFNVIPDGYRHICWQRPGCGGPYECAYPALLDCRVLLESVRETHKWKFHKSSSTFVAVIILELSFSESCA